MHSDSQKSVESNKSTPHSGGTESLRHKKPTLRKSASLISPAGSESHITPRASIKKAHTLDLSQLTKYSPKFDSSKKSPTPFSPSTPQTLPEFTLTSALESPVSMNTTQVSTSGTKTATGAVLEMSKLSIQKVDCNEKTQESGRKKRDSSSDSKARKKIVTPESKTPTQVCTVSLHNNSI
jgi:hypothetical protein